MATSMPKINLNAWFAEIGSQFQGLNPREPGQWPLAPKLAARAPGDPILWFAYPKGTSKKLTCDFNRDTGWARLAAAGFDTVRSIAIDEDWTALRFRRNEYIKSR